MTNNDNTLWHIAVTEPRKEAVVMAQLKPSLYEVYRPVVMLPVIVNGKGRIVWKPKPLFPAHLFVRKLSPRSGPISRLIGINFIYPQAVRDGVLDEVRKAERDSYDTLIPKAKPRMKGALVGMNVTTLDGMLKAVIVRVVDAERVEILSTFLNAEHTMTVSLDQLQPAALP